MIFIRAIATIILLTTASVTSAGRLPRQIQGSAECNQARGAIVQALRQTSINVQQIQDPTVQQAASAGVDQAAGGIRQIAQALQAGQAPPPQGRNITEAGLTATGNALAGGNVNDPAVAAAQQSLNQAVQAGQNVVALC